MFKKLLVLFLIPCFFVNVSYAEEAVMKTLDKGQKAPFSGTLLNQQAVKEMILKINSAEEEYKLRLKKEADTQKANCDFSIERLKIAHSFEIDVYKSQVGFLNNQVNLSTKQLEKNNFSSDLWFVGGFVAGALLVLGISYVSINVVDWR